MQPTSLAQCLAERLSRQSTYLHTSFLTLTSPYCCAVCRFVLLWRDEAAFSDVLSAGMSPSMEAFSGNLPVGLSPSLERRRRLFGCSVPFNRERRQFVGCLVAFSQEMPPFLLLYRSTCRLH
jgi:hypothetical protein